MLKDLHEHGDESNKHVDKVEAEDSNHEQPFTGRNIKYLENSEVLKHFPPAHCNYTACVLCPLIPGLYQEYCPANLVTSI